MRFSKTPPPRKHFDVWIISSFCDQRLNNADPTLKMKQNPTSDIQSCTALIQRQCPTLKLRRNNVVSTFLQRSFHDS